MLAFTGMSSKVSARRYIYDGQTHSSVLSLQCVSSLRAFIVSCTPSAHCTHCKHTSCNVRPGPSLAQRTYEFIPYHGVDGVLCSGRTVTLGRHKKEHKTLPLPPHHIAIGAVRKLCSPVARALTANNIAFAAQQLQNRISDRTTDRPTV